jgi:hypothetical protein
MDTIPAICFDDRFAFRRMLPPTHTIIVTAAGRINMAARVSFQFMRNKSVKNVSMLMGSTRSFWKLTEKVLRMMATSFRTMDVRSPARERLKKDKESDVK